MITGHDIVEYSRTWLGTKWRHQGRNHRGIDCAGLLIKICENFNLDFQDKLGYSRIPDGSFKRTIEEQTLHCNKNDILNGCIGIFRDSTFPCHTGIFSVTSNKVSLIHSDASLSWRRVHEEEFDTNHRLYSRLMSVRLFKEVTYA